MKIYNIFKLLILITFIYSCNSDDAIYERILMAEENEELSGEEATVFNTSSSAFGFHAANLEGDNVLFFFTGNSLFDQNWVTVPASTTARDGLGPFFNARSCASCHFKDGRGRAPEFDGEIWA